jgi:hypothetical protein
MLVYKDQLTFNILDQPVHLISNETSYGQQTVAEINNEYLYLSAKDWTLSIAIMAYERLNGRELTKAEITQVLRDNNFTSQRI